MSSTVWCSSYIQLYIDTVSMPQLVMSWSFSLHKLFIGTFFIYFCFNYFFVSFRFISNQFKHNRSRSLLFSVSNVHKIKIKTKKLSSSSSSSINLISYLILALIAPFVLCICICEREIECVHFRVSRLLQCFKSNFSISILYNIFQLCFFLRSYRSMCDLACATVYFNCDCYSWALSRSTGCWSRNGKTFAFDDRT